MKKMAIKGLFDCERYLASTRSAYSHEEAFQLLDRVEAAVTERIEDLEARLGVVADIAHNGGLIGYQSEWDALCEIRRLTTKYLPGKTKI